MNVTESISNQIGGNIKEFIDQHQEIQVYANDNLNTYQWRDNRLEHTVNQFNNPDSETRQGLIEILKTHLKSTNPELFEPQTTPIKSAEYKPLYFDLFQHLHEQHDLILLDSEMQEIIGICQKHETDSQYPTADAKEFLIKELKMSKIQADTLYEDYILACAKFASLQTTAKEKEFCERLENALNEIIEKRNDGVWYQVVCDVFKKLIQNYKK